MIQPVNSPFQIEKVGLRPAMKTSLLSCVLALLASACDVESTSSNTGGVDDSDAATENDTSAETTGDAAAAVEVDAGDRDAGESPPTPVCNDGMTVVMSDYVSTQVALTDLKGATKSASFVSSASTQTQGLAFALSGDVVLPSSAPASGRIVLLDRFGTNVVSWFDPKTSEALGQLAVGTGFESNPQDYVEVDEKVAFISRWGQNAAPGQEDFDAGDDVLVVDTRKFSILDSIAMPEKGGLPPRPGDLIRMGDEIVVMLKPLSNDYATTGEAWLVGISIEEWEITWQLHLEGLKDCGGFALSPDRKTLALACTGGIDFNGVVEDLGQSAVVLLDATTSPPEELERVQADDIVGEPLQPDAEFATNDQLLLKTQTAYGGGTNNRWLLLDLESKDTESLLEAQPDGEGLGKGIVYGGMSCAPGCSDMCVMADADSGRLQRLEFDEDGAFELLEAITVEDEVGLPPRTLVQR